MFSLGPGGGLRSQSLRPYFRAPLSLHGKCPNVHSGVDEALTVSLEQLLKDSVSHPALGEFFPHSIHSGT